MTRRFFWVVYHFILHFNSHPHKEDDCSCYKQCNRSIQFQLTSSQGGWQKQRRDIAVFRVFQLTSSQGGWHGRYGARGERRGFQLTSSQGGWRCQRTEALRRFVISTHILTRRMTTCHAPVVSSTGHFNSHPHKEDDGDALLLRPLFPHFNSHPHKEDDRHTSHHGTLVKYFNSHPHKEDDGTWRFNLRQFRTFQLTSSQGGWRKRLLLPQTYNPYFNSHPHKEDDRTSSERITRPQEFQLTSSQGGWHHATSAAAVEKPFQLTSSQGGWRRVSFHPFRYTHFNSHPHKEDDFAPFTNAM